MSLFFFFFNDTATTEIYTYRHTLSLHDALPISRLRTSFPLPARCSSSDLTKTRAPSNSGTASRRSEEHTSELQSLMRISYAVFCLKKKNKKQKKSKNPNRYQNNTDNKNKQQQKDKRRRSMSERRTKEPTN